MKNYRLKDISKIKRGASPRPINDTKYFSEDGIYSWVRIADVTKSNKYLLNTEEKLSTIGSQHSVRLNKETLFLSIAGSVGKPCINKIKVCIHDGFIYFTKLKYNIDYLFWFLNNPKIYEGKGKIGTQLNLNIETVENIFCPNISSSTQTAIANYLDHHTSKIDNEVTLLEKKATLLEEYKQSLIYETVTKGLDKNVPMKDSGIDWIGEIPVHWEVNRIKDFSYCYAGGTPDTSREDYWENGTYFWAASGNLKNGLIKPEKLKKITKKAIKNSSTKFIFPFTTLLAMTGATCGDTGYSNINLYANQSVCAIRNNQYNNYKFLFYFLIGYREQVESLKKGSAQAGISTSDIKHIKIMLPNLGEQLKITNYLDEQCSQIDKKEALINKKIELLKEYKQSLIYEAVTGKITIPEEFY